MTTFIHSGTVLLTLNGTRCPDRHTGTDGGGTARAPNILVVDDTPSNLALLTCTLRDRGYVVRPVPNGALAFRAAVAQPPDLVLLDVAMPGLDGFEVCALLKADPRLSDIPVIFLTAHTDTAEKVRAFEVGGIDYVTKPFRCEEVVARVETHLELRRQKRELRDSYDRLAELERLRDSLVHMVVHDLRSPLTALGGLLSMIGYRVGEQDPQTRRDVETCMSISSRIVDMLTAVLDASKLEAGAMQVDLCLCDLAQITTHVIAEMRGLALDRNVLFGSPPVPAVADPQLITRVVQNLLGNALRFTPRQGTIRIEIAVTEESIRFAMTDEGKQVPRELKPRIFEKYGAVQAGGGKGIFSTGLGLPFCRMAVEAHGGAIGVDDRPDQPGSTFWFTLPRRLPRADAGRAPASNGFRAA